MSRIPPESSHLQFAVGQFRRRFAELASRYREGVVTVSPLGIPVPVSPADSELMVAREVLLRTSHKRVLDSAQCCRSCTSDALDSLQDVRAVLVDQMVTLARSGYQDGALYEILELMLAGILQFLSFVERKSFVPMDASGPLSPNVSDEEIHRVYIPALDDLRQHLLRCLVEVAEIARMSAPEFRMLSVPEWSDGSYVD